MIEVCNEYNRYAVLEDGDGAPEQLVAIGQPITGFEVVRPGLADDTGVYGFGQSDGWAWFCIYDPDNDQATVIPFDGNTTVNGSTTIAGIEAPEDGRWDSIEID